MADEFCSVAALFEEDPDMPVAVADDDTETVMPIRMRFDSPWEWTANVQGNLVTVIPSNGAPIYFNVQEDGSVARPAGISSKRDFRMQVESETDELTRKKSITGLTLVDASGQKVRFNVSNGLGAVNSITSAKGRTTTAAMRSTNVKTLTNESGKLAGCYSSTGGLMKMTAGSDGSQLLAWYSPKKVTTNADGSYTTNGTAFKTASYKMTRKGGVKTTTFTRQQDGLPAQTITHVVNGNITTVTKGEGDETIIHTYETNSLYGNMLEEIATVRGINDATPASCTRTVRQYTDGGWLLISQTDAYNTPIAQTTTYEYNAQYRVSRINYHNGNYIEYEYDSEGRVTKETRPWGDGGKKMTRNVYAANSTRFYDTRPIKVYTDYEMADGTVLNLAVTDYTYEDSAEVERTTATTYAAGVNHQQVTIDEAYGEAASYAYAAGKPKFSQAVNGVQTWHDYEATTEHGAVHKHTVTTKANGELVAAQSRKTEMFLAEDETTVFTQESIWDGTQWLLLNTTAYEYDAEQRVTKTTRGNGRFTTTEWMCCGVLRETDEDGITTTYAYDSAHQLIETSRDAVYDGDVCVTPEKITEYTRDAAGRVLNTNSRIGAMSATEFTEYDALGRNVKQTDVLGRITTTEYSTDGLTTTVTTPAGATFITTSNPDGSTKEISGTGQRAMRYSYDVNANRLRTTTMLMDGSILGQKLSNGFGQTIVQAVPNTLNGFIYTRSEFNAKGKLLKQYQDTGWNTEKTAATLYEYDSFGNQVKQTLALSDTPTKDNSPVVEMAYSVESMDDGIYTVTTQTRYNAEGAALSSSRKQLMSQLSATLASKSISIDVRGNCSMNWSEYTAPSKVTSFSSIPTSSIVAEVVTVDGLTISQKNHAGITTGLAVQSITVEVENKTITLHMYRRYTASGLEVKQRDGRGNETSTSTDVAGRTVSETDAANAATTTVYDVYHDQPSVITDAMENTSCYKYDLRGRKIAEWGTALQPACFGYDDMDNMTTLRTFRVDNEVITTDPSERSDYDQTTWVFNPVTGLEISKTYADNTSVEKTYDAYNHLATETDARGNVKTHAYEHARGLHLGTSYTVVEGTAETSARNFTYNHLGQMTQVVDDAGIRTFGYNAYGERETDSLMVDGDTHLITDTRDIFGRSTGFAYSKNGTVQHTVTTGYGTDGRISSAGFTHGGAIKLFGYEYLNGTNLLHKLTKPNNMTLTQSYEATRDLLTGMAYHRGSTLVAQREYTYDILGRPTARNTARNGQTVNDTFAHNTRSELVEAQVNGTDYEYTYDNIGNRQQATEGNDVTLYDANALNQYTSISENGGAAFVPQFDVDGNQTLIKTDTGIWSAVYNAENRPVTFTNSDSSTVVECAYDSMGRRAYKKVTVNGNVTLHQRYIYRGYLQIACIDLTRSHHPVMWLVTWDPTQPVATRPLAIRINGTWYTYGWDLTKNICELYSTEGRMSTNYTYSPFGKVTTTGSLTQPIQWSSEMWDSELGLVYYNWRYYNFHHGRWCSRDFVFYHNNYYCYVKSPLLSIDIKGNWFAAMWDFIFGNSSQNTPLDIPLEYKDSDQFTREYKETIRQLAEKYNTPWIITALNEIGVADYIKDGKRYYCGRIKEYIKYSPYYRNYEKSNEYFPWCACFANYVLVSNNLSVPKKERFRARSYRSCWRQIDKPAFGALYVKVNADLTGHVAFVVAENTSHVFVLGGNQSHSVRISRYLKSNLVTYHLPEGVELHSLPTVLDISTNKKRQDSTH